MNSPTVEIFYGLPAYFGAYGVGLTQHYILRYASNLEWEILNLKRKGAKDIRYYLNYSSSPVCVE